MGFTRKPSQERKLALIRSYPKLPPNAPVELVGWYEDLKNVLQEDLSEIEAAFSKIEETQSLFQRITELESQLEAVKVAAGSRWLVRNEDVAPNAAITESKLNLNHATHSNENDPTEDEKAAMVGTEGVPSAENPFVTSTDPRLAQMEDAMAQMPVGTVIGWGGDVTISIPYGWILCDGSEYSREEHSALYGVTGDLWGAGDGTTTFNAPNLTGTMSFLIKAY